MRFGFREHLETLGKIAKDEMKDGLSSEEEREIEGALAWHTRKRAQERLSDIDAQSGIYDLQGQKQQIMLRLKQEIAQLDDPEYQPERAKGERLVMYNKGNGKYYLTEQGMEPVTVGEMLTDGEWDIDYYLDPKTVPKVVRKRYLVEHVKTELRNLLDQQIIAEEASSGRVHEWKQETYRKVGEEREAELLPPGIIVEKMVRNLLKKYSLDCGMDFEIIETDVFQDVEQKLDFIIKIKLHHRGVEVQADDKIESVGVQFTTNPTAEAREHKQEQIERSKRHLQPEDRIQDIVLVQIPKYEAISLYKNWQGKKGAGGPDKLWPDKVKETIFRQVLSGMLKPEEIDNQWATTKRPREQPMAPAA